MATPILKLNVLLNCPENKVIIVDKAISNSQGKVAIKVLEEGSPYASIFSTASKRYWTRIVECDTLDNIITKLNIREVSLLKVDIEGSEGIAFKGMRRTLEITDKLIIEIQPNNLWLISELKQMGFKLIDKRGKNYFFAIGNPK